MAVRIGIIGAGWVAAHRYAPVLAAHPRADLCAVADSSGARSAAFASRFSIASSFDRLEPMLSAGLDAVVVCTPPRSHPGIVRAALQAGVHVCCEKPLALRASEAAELFDAAAAAGRTLCAAHNQLFSRAVTKASRIAADAPRIVSGLQLSSPHRRLPRWYRDLPGGLLTDEAPHMLYLLRHFLGPLRLDDVRGRVDGNGQPTWVDVGVTGASGPGRLQMVFDSPVSEWHLGIVTSGAAVDVDLFRDVAVRRGRDGAHRPLDILATSAVVGAGHAAGVVASGARHLRGRLLFGHDALLGRFVDAVETGGPSPVDERSVVETTAVSEAILDALGVLQPA